MSLTPMPCPGGLRGRGRLPNPSNPSQRNRSARITNLRSTVSDISGRATYRAGMRGGVPGCHAQSRDWKFEPKFEYWDYARHDRAAEGWGPARAVPSRLDLRPGS